MITMDSDRPLLPVLSPPPANDDAHDHAERIRERLPRRLQEIREPYRHSSIMPIRSHPLIICQGAE